MVHKQTNFEIAALFHCPYRRVKKGGKFKANLSFDQMVSILHCLSSSRISRNLVVKSEINYKWDNVFFLFLKSTFVTYFWIILILIAIACSKVLRKIFCCSCCSEIFLNQYPNEIFQETILERLGSARFFYKSKFSALFSVRKRLGKSAGKFYL